MKKPKLSVALVTRNEEERLRACLESVAWADEIVVVDAESDDKTATIAREFTDRVVVRPWPGYAAQKNTALDLATGDWTLSLDADEIVSASSPPTSRACSRPMARPTATPSRGGTSSGDAGSATAGSTPTGRCDSSAAAADGSARARSTNP